jgi:hypothetical protein
MAAAQRSISHSLRPPFQATSSAGFAVCRAWLRTRVAYAVAQTASALEPRRHGTALHRSRTHTMIHDLRTAVGSWPRPFAKSRTFRQRVSAGNQPMQITMKPHRCSRWWTRTQLPPIMCTARRSLHLPTFGLSPHEPASSTGYRSPKFGSWFAVLAPDNMSRDVRWFLYDPRGQGRQESRGPVHAAGQVLRDSSGRAGCGKLRACTRS